MATVALKAGAGWIQYREKEKSRREIYHEALRLRGLTQGAGAMFVVNDHADIALAVDADGVHLGQDDLPLSEARKMLGKRIIGISTHSLPEAMQAAWGGADYIGFGPVFHTSTKEAGEPKGVEMLREIKRHVKIPVVAIGGISPENLSEVLDAGADGVAVASAIFRGDIYENVRSFMKGIAGK
jgi:thiamine-phosphate pyrophosphorylase